MTTSTADRAAELQASIAAQVEAMANSDEWRHYLDSLSQFHNYSLRNVLLILAQRPDATAVAGYKAWREKHGRQVRKGEKAIRIFGYSPKTAVETDPATGKEERKVVAVRFPILSVFDMSQTEPIEGADHVDQPTYALTGADPTNIYGRVEAEMTARGWSVTRGPIDRAEVNGYTTMTGSKEIVVLDTLAPAQAAKTMIHEAAHALLHYDDNTHGRAEGSSHQGIREVEAESVAYVVAGVLGLDTSNYSVGYITGWSGGDTDLIAGTARRVLDAAHTLIDALTE